MRYLIFGLCMFLGAAWNEDYPWYESAVVVALVTGLLAMLTELIKWKMGTDEEE